MSGTPIEELVSSCRKLYQTDYNYHAAIDLAVKVDENASLAAIQLLAEIYATWHHHFKNRELRSLYNMDRATLNRLAVEAEKFRQIADRMWNYDNGLTTVWKNPCEKSPQIFRIIQATISKLTESESATLESEIQKQLKSLYPKFNQEVTIISYRC